MVFKFYVSILLSITLINCNDRSELNSTETMKTVNYVDLEKYMGDWYVIANIPTFIEKNAACKDDVPEFVLRAYFFFWYFAKLFSNLSTISG